LELLARSVRTLLGFDVESLAAPAAAKPAAVAPAKSRAGLRVTGDRPAKTTANPRTARTQDGPVESGLAVAAGSRRPRTLALIAAAASLFGLVALVAIVIAIKSKGGEAKTTNADDSADQVGSGGTSGGQARSDNGPARHANMPGGSLGAKPPIRLGQPNLIPPAGPLRRALAVVGASWSVDGDQLVKQGVGRGWVVFGDDEWTEYDFTFEALKSAGPAGFGATFAASKGRRLQRDSYGLEIGGPNGKHYVRRWLGATRQIKPLYSIPGTIQPFKWYRLKVSFRGNRVRIELDDGLIFAWTDNINQRGAASLQFYNSAGRFRNIKITAPNGAVLWEGLPDLHTQGRK
jgi:hypothetical protein